MFGVWFGPGEPPWVFSCPGHLTFRCPYPTEVVGWAKVFPLGFLMCKGFPLLGLTLGILCRLGLPWGGGSAL